MTAYVPRVLTRSTVELAGWTIILLTIAIGPIFVVLYPGLQDYPNHLARGFILLHSADPILRPLYDVQWTPLPNLGWDIWAVVVGRVLPLEWTGRLYLAVSGLSVVLGCFALNRALLSRWTFAPLLSVPLLFSSAFRMGFLNFELGVGCALLAAASWISADRMHWIRQLILATIISTGLYFIHFYGWAFYGVLVLGYELHLIWRRANRLSDVGFGLAHLLRDGTQAIPALAMLVYAGNTSGTPALTVLGYKPPYIRIGQIEHLIDIGHPILNAAIFVLFGLLIGVLFCRRWLEFRRDLIWPIVICLCIFFMLPDVISNTFYVSWRILLMTLLIAIASFSPSQEGEARITPIMTVFALITVFVVSLQMWQWRSSESGREAFVNIVQNVPEGSSLFVVHNGMTSQQLTSRAIGLYHVGAYAVLTRRALVQSMFVLPGQQVLRFSNPAIQSAPASSATMLSEIKREFRKSGIDLSTHLQHFDYVVVHGPDSGDDLKVLSSTALTLIGRQQDFRLYKVAKDY
jgi:hypothetical protein